MVRPLNITGIKLPLNTFLLPIYKLWQVMMLEMSWLFVVCLITFWRAMQWKQFQSKHWPGGFRDETWVAPSTRLNPCGGVAFFSGIYQRWWWFNRSESRRYKEKTQSQWKRQNGMFKKIIILIVIIDSQNTNLKLLFTGATFRNYSPRIWYHF